MQILPQLFVQITTRTTKGLRQVVDIVCVWQCDQGTRSRRGTAVSDVQNGIL